MGSLEFKLRRDNYASVQDVLHELDISEIKWTSYLPIRSLG
jgi:hypothetical protein